MLITETALAHLTFSLNMRADQLRARNFYCHAQAVMKSHSTRPTAARYPIAASTRYGGTSARKSSLSSVYKM
jgi:hypothetical protein